MDILSVQAIEKHLGPTLCPWRLQVVENTDSTNTRLKEAAKAGARENILLAADHQTAGRGRLGRSFLSPAGSGIYMSLLLHPALPMARCTDLTVAAAVCAARALKKLCGLQADIKWVNDLYVGGKKLCGILTEGALGQNGMADYVVVGIGLNVGRLNCGDDAELAAIITSLEDELGHTVDRSQLIAAILCEFDRYYADMEQNHPSMLEEYRRRMFLTGKEVTLSTDPEKRPHLVLGVDENAGLLVRTPEGGTLTLQSGEVSIRKI